MHANVLRQLPAVHKLLDLPAAQRLVERYGHPAVVTAIQAVLADFRQRIQSGTLSDPKPIDAEALLQCVEQQMHQEAEPHIKPAINATGILLHTGLGRAVMPETARHAVASVMGCCNLQMDLNDGARLHREHVIKELICGLTGAEDVVLVNNNAAATLLALRALAHTREVIVSRGELIEIGGSFRIPDILEESGATLREVGTTNKTHLRDYQRAITPETGLILKVHKSNYDIIGFTKEVSIGELAELAHAHALPVLDDLGCGAMIDLERYGLAHEMTLRESLAAGADLVLSSTDKLIGGPQGGLILGKARYIEQIRKHPLYRAFRVCKMTLAALEATLRLFKNPETLERDHPLYRMLARTPEELKQQAEHCAAQLRNAVAADVAVTAHEAYLGGGSLPTQTLPSFAVALTFHAHAVEDYARALREAAIPVVPRIFKQALLLDMRTVLPEECEHLIATVRAAWAH